MHSAFRAISCTCAAQGKTTRSSREGKQRRFPIPDPQCFDTVSKREAQASRNCFINTAASTRCTRTLRRSSRSWRPFTPGRSRGVSKSNSLSRKHELEPVPRIRIPDLCRNLCRQLRRKNGQFDKGRDKGRDKGSRSPGSWDRPWFNLVAHMF